MDIGKWISGFLTVEVTSAEPEIAISSISNHGIELLNLEKHKELTYSFQIPRRDFALLRSICIKKGDSMKIVSQTGLSYFLPSVLCRKSLVVGLLLLFFFSLFLPTRVLFLRVEGNISVPERKILEAAEEAGIEFGVSRRKVRSEKVKNRLLSSIAELQWAGINTSGCVATISVRERSEPEKSEVARGVTKVIAARDGYILSAVASDGNLLVQPGQTVKAGQTLISGYTDCGTTIQASRSCGEIYAITNRDITAIMPSKWLYRTVPVSSDKKISLLWRKKRINLWKGSGNVSPVCGRMYQEYYVTLPGEFSLPLGICIESSVRYETVFMEISPEHSQTILSEFAEDYLNGHMSAGKIMERTESCTLKNGVFLLHGEYLCTEMIGREQPEQIGDHNGKND